MNFALLGRGFWKIITIGPGFYWIVIIIWLLFGLHLFFGRLEKLIVGCLFGVGGWW
jgi:hypothetical protein